MTTCLYLTETKPSRKNARQLAEWLKDNYPDCAFTEVNADKKSPQNNGRYQGRVDGPATWREVERLTDRQAILDAARRLLAE